jgi:hypothetical protein
VVCTRRPSAARSAPRWPRRPLSDEELARKFHDDAVRSLPAELAARTLALSDVQRVEDLTALLTSAGER